MTEFDPEDGSTPRASARNWRAYAAAAGAGALLLGGTVWWVAHDTAPPAKPSQTAPTATNVLASMPERKFTPPAPAPSPAPPPVARDIYVPPAAVTAPAAPAKPPALANVFVTVTDQDAVKAYEGPAGGHGTPPQTAAWQDEYRPGMSDGVDRLGDDDRQGLAAEKNRWLASAGSRGQDFVVQPFSPAVAPMMLQAGTIVHAAMTNGLNTDLPGAVFASVTYDVMDSVTGSRVLIPAGSTLQGVYSNQLAFAQSRAQFAWTRVLFCDGTSQNIGSMVGTDDQGMAGAEGEVDRHPGGMAAAIGGAALFSIIGQTGQILQATEGGGGNPTAIGVVGTGAGGAGQATRSIGQQMVQRQLNRPNTITLKPGDQVALLLTKDVALPPADEHTGVCR